MRANQFILREYSREVTAQKLGAALLQKFQKEPPAWQQRIVNAGTEPTVVLDHLLGRIEVADPTKNKQYVPWIIRMYVNNPSLKFEDAVSHVSIPLKKFFQLVSKKQIPAPNNDIGRIKDLAGLVQIVDQYPDVVDEPRNVDRGQVKPYYEDADIRVLIPQDMAAACYYGQGTKWCTAGRENNMFDRYNSSGEMYIILPKKPAYAGEKYQFHFSTKQFMDEKDHRVNLTAMRNRFPQLVDIFEKQAKEHHILALDKDITDLSGTIKRALPIFRESIKTLIRRDGRRKAREIFVELGNAVKVFKGMEETWELAEDMFEEKAGDLASLAAHIIANDPDLAYDEDGLYDELSNHIPDLTRRTELWFYCIEVLEELENEEAEFDVAMTIDGEILSMMQELIPHALSDSIETVK